MSNSFEVTNRNLAILYIVANDHAPAKDEPQSMQKHRTNNQLFITLNI